MSRFPLTFALVASAAFFSLSLIALAACILPAVKWPVSVDQSTTVSEPKEDRPSRVRKRPRKNVAGESRVAGAVRSNHTYFHDPWSQHSQAYKSEDTLVDVPSALGSDNFALKRRRSRMSDVLLDSEN